ncbi:MAG: hypothetical protein AAF485_32450 [Chloroflexota bacterium]
MDKGAEKKVWYEVRKFWSPEEQQNFSGQDNELKDAFSESGYTADWYLFDFWTWEHEMHGAIAILKDLEAEQPNHLFGVFECSETLVLKKGAVK